MSDVERKTAVVTGASGGIGAATARALAAAGYHVVVTARRLDRLEALAKEIGGTARTLDVTDRPAVDAFGAWFAEEFGASSSLSVLVNNAGGAIGTETVAAGDPEDWRTMYEVNVLGTLHVTQVLMPRLIASGDGVVVILSSVAGLVPYEGGGGYVAAKHAEHSMAGTLRLELLGEPVRVVEIAPGMVQSEGFAVTRFRGDETAAAKVYAGVPDPLTSEDVAETVAWAVTRPPHVNIDLLVVRPRAQAAAHKVLRITE
ncbi:oxidoreductase [Mangrovactinospora gilvigrisea]|uniref:Oxidoreductase n=1 Tax=Mangrovactinospora gilvigrisea TaxID=1428644 RepID=A0A1J7BUC9_9ACTN|nr:SDR family NAD(P)-dependent oxidoreductase [Mangrovactinospora gilvigrisea]OIV37065.1 oxidoreductase [Mangrovactinospora gilvigrisea]